EQGGATLIGNAGEAADGMVASGDVTVTANGTDGISLVLDCCGSQAMIGNFAAGDGAQISGDITVTANYGGVSLDNDSDSQVLPAIVQIGNAGFFESSDLAVSGNILVTAGNGDVSVRATNDGA